jgi:hypothetical protein
VAVAPRELRDREAAADTLAECSGSPGRGPRGATRSDRPWVRTFPGVYPPRVRERWTGSRESTWSGSSAGSNPYEGLALGTWAGHRRVEGRGDRAGLRGAPEGDPREPDRFPGLGGRPIPGESWVIQEPRAGGDVVLTLDRDLQEIATRRSEAAIARPGPGGATSS